MNFTVAVALLLLPMSTATARSERRLRRHSSASIPFPDLLHVKMAHVL